MENAHLSAWFKTTQKASVSLALALSALAASAMPLTAAAVFPSWDPTLIVNTEALLTIDDGDGSSPIELRFGSAANVIRWDPNDGIFDITAGLDVYGTITASGDVLAQGDVAASGQLRLNTDDSGDATITFGNATLDETLTFSESNSQFEFSDDLQVTGNVTATDTLSGDQLVVSSGDVKVNGVQYSFPGTQGGANEVLYNDGSGNLAWGSVNDLGLSIVGSGAYVTVHPEYPNVAYEGDGSNNVGQMRVEFDATDEQSYYTWITTGSDQDYDIVYRWTVPENFHSWQDNAIIYSYKTADGTTANGSVAVTVFDTTYTSDHADGELASGTAATATITAAELDGTYTDGSHMTVRIKVKTDNGNETNMGYIKFAYFEELLN